MQGVAARRRQTVLHLSQFLDKADLGKQLLEIRMMSSFTIAGAPGYPMGLSVGFESCDLCRQRHF